MASHRPHKTRVIELINILTTYLRTLALQRPRELSGSELRRVREKWGVPLQAPGLVWKTDIARLLRKMHDILREMDASRIDRFKVLSQTRPFRLKQVFATAAILVERMEDVTILNGTSIDAAQSVRMHLEASELPVNRWIARQLRREAQKTVIPFIRRRNLTISGFDVMSDLLTLRAEYIERLHRFSRIFAAPNFARSSGVAVIQPSGYGFPLKYDVDWEKLTMKLVMAHPGGAQEALLGITEEALAAVPAVDDYSISAFVAASRYRAGADIEDVITLPLKHAQVIVFLATAIKQLDSDSPMDNFLLAAREILHTRDAIESYVREP